MDRKLIWTEKASDDLQAIVRYIALHDPHAAARIGNGIYDRAQILLRNPEAGTILKELVEGGWWKLIFWRWNVYVIRGYPTSLAVCGRPL
jgi:plasmid stabilization system protein ParE